MLLFGHTIKHTNYPLYPEVKEMLNDLNYETKYGTKEKALESAIKYLSDLKEQYKYVEDEINITKETKGLYEQPGYGQSVNFTVNEDNYSTKTDALFDEDGGSLETTYFKNNNQIGNVEYLKAKEEASKQGLNTQYYSNLTVQEELII
jgi:hypothetical protein